MHTGLALSGVIGVAIDFFAELPDDAPG